MREIITLPIGQTGISIGNQFWQLACQEHGIESSGYYHGHNDLQLDYLNVYFSSTTNGRYIPRSIFFDVDQIKMKSSLFHPEWIIQGKTGTSNNFAKGYLTEGAQILTESMEMIRKVAEECDLVHAFQFIHSISGGTGGGFGSLLIDQIREEYADRIRTSFSILPALSMSQVVIEPYNSLLTMTHLMENTDQTFCFDNLTLFDILNKTLRLTSRTFDDINYLIGQVMTGISACFRFPGQLNMDLRKLSVNMIPFPSVHFLVTSFSPLITRHSLSYQKYTEHTLVNQMFDRHYQMLKLNHRQGKYLTATGIFRGQTLSIEQLHELFSKEKQKQSFVHWIANNCKVAHCDIPPIGLTRSVTGIANHTGIREEFEKILQPFEKLYRRRAFLHWFLAEGIEENELTEAENRCKDLINDYKQYEETKENDNDDST